MGKKKLLIIDDEKEFVETMAERLRTKGYDIISAFDGASGLEKAHTAMPDLIMLDVMMPEMSGFDVCEKLKVDEKYKNIPIIMLTAKFQPADIEFSKALGADAYITKPFELEVLLDMIRKLLKEFELKKGTGT